jgi:hypothetical protein
MADSDPKLQFDKELLQVYLTGLQSEVEAKLRAVNRFREQMERLDAPGSRARVEARRQTARALIAQVATMLETNGTVREILHEIKAAAESMLADIEEQSNR